MQRQVDKIYSKLDDFNFYTSPCQSPTFYTHFFCGSSPLPAPAPARALFAFWFKMSEMVEPNTFNFLAHLVKLSMCVCVWTMSCASSYSKSALMRLGGPVVSFELRLILPRVRRITT